MRSCLQSSGTKQSLYSGIISRFRACAEAHIECHFWSKWPFRIIQCLRYTCIVNSTKIRHGPWIEQKVAVFLYMYTTKTLKDVLFNPFTAKLFNLNFHPHEVVSRWRDPQLQVSENYSDLTKWRSTIFKSCWLMANIIFNIFKMWYLMCRWKMKTRIYAAPAVKGLSGMVFINIALTLEALKYVCTNQKSKVLFSILCHHTCLS